MRSGNAQLGSQEEEQEGSAGANSDSDAEFEQMLAEADEPKAAPQAGAADDAPKDDEAAAALVRLSFIRFGFAT